MTPSVTVVIPTYNRRERLHRVLEALRAQVVEGSSVEVVVVSDGSTDGTDEYLASPAVPLTVRAVSQPNQGPAAARNTGVGLARGALVLFLDDDVVPLPGLVAEHLAAHARHGPQVVVLGPMLTPPDFPMTPWVRYEQAMLTKQYDAMIRGEWDPTPRQFYTGNVSLRRDHVLAAGGFDTTFTRAEDVELAYRLAARGLEFTFVPQAAGWHYAERPYESWRRTAYAYGRNDVVFACDKGQGWLLEAMASERRHPLLRLWLRTVLGRPTLGRMALTQAERAAMTSARLGAQTVSRAAFSAIFNTLYQQGARDELAARMSTRADGSTPSSPSIRA